MPVDKAARRRIFYVLITLLLAAAVTLPFAWSGADEPVTITGVGRATLADPLKSYDPFRAGEAMPDGFRQLVRRDDIATVYDPVFVDADETDWDPATLVIGVEIAGDARAYPVNYMNVHEMVDDTVGLVPILVSW